MIEFLTILMLYYYYYMIIFWFPPEFSFFSCNHMTKYFTNIILFCCSYFFLPAILAAGVDSNEWTIPGELPPSHFLQAHGNNRTPKFVDVLGSSAHSTSQSSLFQLDLKMRPLPPGMPIRELGHEVIQSISTHAGELAHH